MQHASDVATETTTSGKSGGQVIYLRRYADHPVATPPSTPDAVRCDPPVVPDLAAFERTPERDDYVHRMIVNALALVFTVALTAAGIWLADSMASLRKNQDCALIGRADCAHVNVAPATRG
jgi:hypothetical protein